MAEHERIKGRGIICLAGMPRSGTTWIGKIFDSHPKVLYRHEPDSVQRLDSIPIFADLREVKVFSRAMRSWVVSLNSNKHMRVCGKLPLFKKSYLSPVLLLLQWSNVIASKSAYRLNRWNVPVFGASWGSRAKNVVWVWKSIESVGRLGVIISALPQSRSIHILRHPCGYIASIFRGRKQSYLSNAIPASDDYTILGSMVKTNVAEKYGIDLPYLKTMDPEERLAWRWVITNEKAIIETKGSGRNMLVRYEDLCTQPVAVAKRLFRHASLPWNQQTEKFLKQSTRRDESGYYGVYKKPSVAAERWKNELGKNQIEKIIKIAQQSIPGKKYFP